MDYRKLYESLIGKAKCRNKPKEYVENHHIIPKWKGGKNSPSNLVWLTAREHYIAHLLLAKWEGGRHWSAVKIVCEILGFKKSRFYALAREEAAKLTSKRMKGDHHYMKQQKYRDNQSSVMKKRIKEQGNISSRKDVAAKISNYKTSWHAKNPDHMTGDKNPMRNPEIAARSAATRKANRELKKGQL